jgi:hypothetical protein
VEQFDVHAGAQFAAEDADVRDDALVGVKIGIKPQGLERGRAGRRGRRDAMHDGFEDVVDADALLGAGQEGVVAGNG